MTRKNAIISILEAKMIASKENNENYFDETFFYFERCARLKLPFVHVYIGFTSSKLLFIARILN